MLRCDACCEEINRLFGYPRKGFRGGNVAGFARTVHPVIATCEVCKTENVPCSGVPSREALKVEHTRKWHEIE